MFCYEASDQERIRTQEFRSRIWISKFWNPLIAARNRFLQNQSGSTRLCRAKTPSSERERQVTASVWFNRVTTRVANQIFDVPLPAGAENPYSFLLTHYAR